MFETFFLLRHFVKVIYDKMVDGSHPKSFSEHFRRGVMEAEVYGMRDALLRRFREVVEGERSGYGCIENMEGG